MVDIAHSGPPLSGETPAIQTDDSTRPLVLDAISIIRPSLRSSLHNGKLFRAVNGEVVKTSLGGISGGIVTTHHAPTFDAMKTLLESVTAEHDTVAIMGTFIGHDERPFALHTRDKLAEMEGRPAGEPPTPRVLTIHGQRHGARSAEAVERGEWLLLDFDFPSYMPDQWRNLYIGDLLALMEPFWPGISRATRLECRSSGARARGPGEAPGKRSHAYVRVKPEHVDRVNELARYLRIAAGAHGLTFTNPDDRRQRPLTLVDLVTFNRSQPVYCGAPHIAASAAALGWVDHGAGVQLIEGEDEFLDLSCVEVPSSNLLRLHNERTGTRFSIDGGPLLVDEQSLTLETEIESKWFEGGRRRMTFGEVLRWLGTLPLGDKRRDHFRCEAMFRPDSVERKSDNGIIHRFSDDQGVLIDPAGGVKYRLAPALVEARRMQQVSDLGARMAEIMAPDARERARGTNQVIPAGMERAMALPDTLAVERLAADFAALNLSAAVLPDAATTRLGRATSTQITTAPRVAYVIRTIELSARMNVYARLPIISSARSDWYDPASDDSAAIVGALGHACARCGMSGRSIIEDTIMEEAGRNLFNPVLDWARSVPWDGRSRFRDLVASIDMVDRSLDPWKEIVLRRMSIQAVTAWQNFERGDAAIAVPYMPVLAGVQGCGKTRLVASLLPAGLVKTEMSLRLDHHERDAISRVTAHAIVELSEVDGSFRKSDVASLKTFLGTSVDRHRPPYGRRDVSTPRCTVYFGTVNELGFLMDATGGRRFWPLHVERCHHDHGVDMQQYWAEVLTWSEPYWLTGDEAAMHARIVAEHEADTTVGELVAELQAAREEWPDSGEGDARWKQMGATILLAHAGIRAGNPAVLSELRSRMIAAGFVRRANSKKWRVPSLDLWRVQLGAPPVSPGARL